MSGKSWFSKLFGFLEHDDYAKNCEAFHFDPEVKVLTSKPNGAMFYVGPFECPTVADLRSRRLEIACAPGDDDDDDADALRLPRKGLQFKELVGDIRALHSCSENNGAVIMVASQFNALEMVGPGVTPEKGITNYLKDQTQGPACALACPAGTVFRNYCVNGTGQGGNHQINNLCDVEKLLEPKKYWKMFNGYSMPITAGSMKELGARLDANPDLSATLVERLRVGVHWDTQVGSMPEQRVCQVFCSAVPVSYCHQTPAKDWASFASLVLEGAYEAVFLAAAILSRQRGGARVRVLITRIGLGAFGNSPAWVRPAIDKACAKFVDEPLDVYLVKFGSSPAIKKK